jgi:hypothetical protein
MAEKREGKMGPTTENIGRLRRQGPGSHLCGLDSNKISARACWSTVV